MKCSVSTAGEEHNVGVSQVFILLCTIRINLRRQVLRKKHAHGFDAHVAFPTLLLHSLTSVPVEYWLLGQELMSCKGVYDMHRGLNGETPPQQTVHTLMQSCNLLSLILWTCLLPSRNQHRAAELEGRQDHFSQQASWSNSHGGHSMSFPRQPTPHPHCPCYWLFVVFVCSFNIQPEFPSSVTNLPAHNISGEQIILVAADIIFQDCNKEQCGYHVFWL